jgi:CubicO group peptidase (beta-lactamase class C family)
MGASLRQALVHFLRKLAKNCRKLRLSVPRACARRIIETMVRIRSLNVANHLARSARWLLAVPLALAVTAASAAECAPEFNPGGVDAEAYGARGNYPAGTMAQRTQQGFMVGSFVSFDRLRPGPTVAAPASASPLTRSCEPFVLRYKHQGRDSSLDDYLTRHPATGFLIAKGSTILVERYQYGRRDTDRFVSQSIAKTITAMLFGLALKDGKIRSLDDRAQDYVPALKGGAYGDTSLRALLTMSSGVPWTETYSGDDDNARFGRALFTRGTPGAAALLRAHTTREVPEGTRFHYASSETEVLGLVLAAATGRRLTDYASERLWKPMGAEANATWSADLDGDILGYCCFSARLRDYARLGILLANDGGGVIPAPWVIEATSAPKESWRAPRKATPFWGYGYQTWLLPEPGRMFALRGIHGQAIFVDPASKLVLVHTAVRLKASNDPTAQELTTLWYALVRQYGKT